MEEKKDSINMIEMLRDKTEETNLAEILKSTFRGYTKKSVQEYFGILRKQQQASQETFHKNLQTLLEEKEALRSNYDALIARYNKLLAEHDSLAESLNNIQLEETGFSAQNFVMLKGNILTMEEEVKISKREKQSLEKKVEQLNDEIKNLHLKLEHSNQETEAHKEMIKIERQELKKQRGIIADISIKLEEEKNEVKYLKATMTDGKFAELNSKIGELHQQLSAQTEIISKLNAESKMSERTIDTLNDEISALKTRLNSTIQTVQNLNLQNDKLLVANDLLKTQLQEEYKTSINMINEKANLSIDRLIAQKNLSSAEAKITYLELQLEKQKKTERIKHDKEVSLSN